MPEPSTSKIDLGVITGLKADPTEQDAQLDKVTRLGLSCCQIVSWTPEDWTPDVGRQLLEKVARRDLTVTAFWAGYSGPRVWNFTEGPRTIGLVPPEHRAQRTKELCAAAGFAASLNLPAIVTHAGFLPEDPNLADFTHTVDALREVAEACEQGGIEFWFETGQETPVTLRRTIEAIGTDNLGVNLDPANLILYGKANPVDALDVFGRYVRGVHAKDGRYPTDPNHLGTETPIGEGKVDFPALIGRLKELGYRGSLTIEREISGPEQEADIRSSIEMLRRLCQ